MANIKDLKKKIKSTKGTLKITTAMKLVSAAKLARAQQAITQARPYALELDAMIKSIQALTSDYKHPYLNDQLANKEEENPNKQAVLLVFSADKGLCGNFNSALAKEVRTFLNETELDIKVFFVGKKLKDLLQKEVNVGKHYQFEKSEPTFLELRSVAEELGGLFSTGEVSRVFVAYNSFKSAISFQSTVRQVLPFSLAEEEKEQLTGEFPFDFKYEPSPKEILDTLIPESYTSTVYTCLLDSVASEHGSRMSAMDNAVKNCKEAIRTLTLKMNKLRQAAITTELIEVVSGAESLKG